MSDENGLHHTSSKTEGVYGFSRRWPLAGRTTFGTAAASDVIRIGARRPTNRARPRPLIAQHVHVGALMVTERVRV